MSAGQAGFAETFQDNVFNAIGLAEFAFFGSVAILINRVNIRLDFIYLLFRV